MLAHWSLRRIAFWVAVIALGAWVFQSPTRAGNTASNLVNTVIGWGQAFISAVITFVGNLA